MEKVILLTGLVRNESLFLNFINEYKRLNKELQYKIYYSTWVGELDKYPSIGSELACIGAFIIEQHEPDLIISGHVVHQICCIDLGLSVIGGDKAVLKMRPDFADINMVHIFSALTLNKAGENSLYPGQQYKYHIHSYIPSQPLYINDITFIGYSADLKLLTLWPVIGAVKYSRTAPEQMIWGGVIFPRIPYLDIFMRVNPGIIFGEKEKSSTMASMLTKSPEYAKTIAIYFSILNESFCDFRGDHTWSEHNNSLLLEECLWDVMPSNKLITHHPQGHFNTFHSVRLVDLLGESCFAGSVFFDSVSECMSEIRSGNFPVLQPDNYLLDFGSELERHYNLYHKTLERTAYGFRCNVYLPFWKLAGQRTERINELENEINQMRRFIDDLNKQIAAH